MAGPIRICVLYVFISVCYMYPTGWAGSSLVISDVLQACWPHHHRTQFLVCSDGEFVAAMQLIKRSLLWVADFMLFEGGIGAASIAKL